MVQAKANKDLLLRLAQNPSIRPVMRSMGLPLPVALDRGSGKFNNPPLAGYKLGAEMQLSINSSSKDPRRLIVDATWVSTSSDVVHLACDVLQPAITMLPQQSRIVLLVCDSHAGAPFSSSSCSSTSLLQAAISIGLSGLARSLAKEMGSGGTTVNVVKIRTEGGKGMDLSLSVWPLGFFLLPDAAYITGQELTVRPPQWQRPKFEPVDEGLLQGKSIMVTGASRGIGEAISLRLAAEGARVIGVDIPSASSKLDGLMKKIGGIAVSEDVTSPEAPERLYEHVMSLEGGGGLDGLVHNAGITRDKTLRKMQRESFEQVMQVNFDAILKINQAFGLESNSRRPAAIREGGRIVLLSSINGVAGAFGQTNYSMTKAGLIGYAHALSPLLFSRGITINSIAPGFIETEMIEKMPAMSRLIGRRSNALSQGGLPSDCAAAVAALFMDQADGVTGQTLRVCGGNMVGR